MVDAAEAQDWVLVGWVRRPVGLRGEVVVQPTGDDPGRFRPGERVFIEGDPYRELKIQRSRPGPKRGIGILFQEVTTVAEAEELRGKNLVVRPEDLPPLPPGVYYHYQLLGLEVVDTEGVVLGRVESILETGSNDVYCVGKGEKEALIPAVRDFVERVDLTAKRILLAVPRSKLGENEPPI